MTFNELSDASFRYFHPQIIREPTAFESIQSTIQTGWNAIASAGAAAGHVAGVGSPPSGVSFVEQDEGKVRRVVRFARWDEVLGRRVLIVGYASSPDQDQRSSVALFTFPTNESDSLSLLVALKLPDNDPKSARDKERFGLTPPTFVEISDAVILPQPMPTSIKDTYADYRPLLAVCSGKVVHFYSLRTQSVVHSITFSSAASLHSVQANARFVVISTSSPPALHVYNATTLQLVNGGSITSVALNQEGYVAYALGRGGRFLAYAATQALPARSTGIFSRPGEGFDSVPVEEEGIGTRKRSDTRRSDSALSGIHGTSGNAGIGMAEDVASAARKVSQNVFTRWKAVSDLWNNSGGAQPQSPPQIQGTISRSEPMFKSPNSLGYVENSLESSASAGFVKVLDLQTMKTVAHFRPTNQTISLLSFSPQSNHILVSPSSAQQFHIFELRPPTPYGGRSAGPGRDGKVWHRYRLNRGLTPARAKSAQWSMDGRFVSVGTEKGTMHVFAIHPIGGISNVQSSFAPKVSNPLDLQPLSVYLEPTVRIRAPKLAHSPNSPNIPTFTGSPVLFFVPHKSPPTGLDSSRRLSSTNYTHSLLVPAFQDVIVFTPQTSQLHLYRLSLVSRRFLNPQVGVVDRGAKLAESAVSGLSKLMSRRPDGTLGEEEQLVVIGERKTMWDLHHEVEEARSSINWEAEEPTTLTKKLDKSQWIAQAEVQTFSRSPRVLPRTIYLSYRFDFYHLPTKFSLKFPLSIPVNGGSDEMVKADVRKEVRVSSFSSVASGEKMEFGEPIRSAMHTILDANPALMPSSPSSLTPMFPNGHPGKTGSWKDSLPVVSPGTMNDGLRTFRREIGKFRKNYRQGSGSGPGSGTISTSLSFDEDAIFAESLEDALESREPTNSKPGVTTKIVYGNSPSTLATMLSDESLEDLTTWNNDPTQDLELEEYDDFKLEEHTLVSLAQQNKLPPPPAIIQRRASEARKKGNVTSEAITPKLTPRSPPVILGDASNNPAWAGSDSVKIGKTKRKKHKSPSPSPSPDLE